MAEEQEYEVETVIGARIYNKRKNKLNWKYQVKWKGYGVEDNTWEPASSFEGGSEHMLTKFWERIDLGGRDLNDVSLFKIGEEFFPKGPPRKVKNKKVNIEGGQEVHHASSAAGSQAQSVPEADKKESGKRRRSSLTQPEDEPTVKRKRGRPSKVDQNTESPAKSKKTLSPNTRAGPISIYSTPATISQGESSPGPSEPNAARSSINNIAIIIPASPEEPANSLLPQEHPPSASPNAETTHSQDIEQSRDSHQTAQDELNDHLFGSVNSVTDSQQPASMNKPSLPSHRARAANPLIKMSDDLDLTHGMNNAISTKARLLAQSGMGVSSDEDSTTADIQGAPTSKRGPGRPTKGLQGKSRSSLLVFEKGSLKSVKGKFTPSDVNTGNASNENAQMDQENGNGIGNDTMEVDDVMASDLPSEKVPTGQELLQMAGLSVEDAQTLPDFEDDALVESTLVPNEALVQSSFTQAVGNLFPTQSSSLFNNFSVQWKRSTIFDPLGFGANADAALQSDAPAALAATRPIWALSLDSSVTIPIVLKDIYRLTGSPSLEDIVAANPKGPPGKFYRQAIASTLLDTLQSGGSSARVEVGEAADETQKQHFGRFRDRLEDGELFVGLAGHEVLAMSFSGNKSVGQTLGVPEMLLGLSGTVIVSRVVIENHSAYADIACQAEHVRW